jgi:single-strand selective monofunctional uracil DNA glycosylase
MAQTGVPFGAVSKVRDWMGLTAPIDRPSREHPKRPVLGFECRREEVSGRRLWSWAQQTYGTPESFFESFWVTNYCPLLFLDEKGRNVTPDKLAKRDREQILPPCDRALALTAQALSIQKIVAIGVWAEQRVRIACAHLPLEIGRILHPSPASPAANRGWATIATRQLRDLGVELPPEHP